MKEGQQYVYLFIAIIALGFTGWYYAQPTITPTSFSKEVLDHLPDVMIDTLHVTQFNEQGLIKAQFDSPHLTHFPFNNQSEFLEPRIVLRPEKGELWHIQSDKGIAEQGSEKFILIDDVIMHQNASGTEKEKTITTSEITYFPEKAWAETQKIVFFEQPGLRVKSEGMTADLKEQKINLSKHVTSEYIPDATK